MGKLTEYLPCVVIAVVVVVLLHKYKKTYDFMSNNKFWFGA